MNKIAINQFALLLNSDLIINESAIELETEINFSASCLEREITVRAEINYLLKKSKALKLDVSCKFSIEEYDWNNFSDDGKIIIPKSFLCNLGVLTLGTCRGILHCKTESSNFNGLILPPINIEDLIDRDLIL